MDFEDGISKGYGFIFIVVFCIVCCRVVFVLLFGCFVLGMEWMWWWCIDSYDLYKMDEVIDC